LAPRITRQPGYLGSGCGPDGGACDGGGAAIGGGNGEGEGSVGCEGRGDGRRVLGQQRCDCKEQQLLVQAERHVVEPRCREFAGAGGAHLSAVLHVPDYCQGHFVFLCFLVVCVRGFLQNLLSSPRGFLRFTCV
jgi:hypothetical protein